MSHVELKGLKALRRLADFTEQEQPTQTTDVVMLALEALEVGQYQPRKEIAVKELQELSASIKAQGILQPIIVRQKGNAYEIIAGERRWRAAKMAGFSTVPVIIRDVEDKVALAFSLIENIQRQDLSAIEEALAFSQFKEEFQMTHAEVADLVGRSRASVTNTIRLLRLAEIVKQSLRLGKLEMGHARALLTLPPEIQQRLAEQIINQSLSVRETELLVQQEKNAEAKSSPYFNDTREWTKSLETSLAAKVKVNISKLGKSKVTLQFKNPADLEALVNLIVENKEKKSSV